MKRFAYGIFCGAVIVFCGAFPAKAQYKGPGGQAAAAAVVQNQGPGTAAQTVVTQEQGPGAAAQATEAPSPSGGGQKEYGPAFQQWKREKEIGPGIPNEEPDSAFVPRTAVIPANDFLDSAIPFAIVNSQTAAYTYDEMVSDIQELKSRYGDLIQVNVIGTSRDGKAIYEIVAGNVQSGKHILIQAAIHAREHMTPLIMMRQLEMLLANYYHGHYDGMAVSELLEKTAIHLIPMSNPDGVALAQQGLSAIGSESLRQTILTCYAQDTAAGRTSLSLEDYLTIWKSNGAGVDLNQNFPASWDEVRTRAETPSYAGYKGPAPLSEPESQALAALSESRQWAATVSYHSMGNIIYWDTVISRVKEGSKALADSVSAVTGFGLDGTDGQGGYKDWMQDRDGAAPSITVEMGSVSCPIPMSEFDSMWQQNKAVLVQIMAHIAGK